MPLNKTILGRTSIRGVTKMVIKPESPRLTRPACESTRRQSPCAPIQRGVPSQMQSELICKGHLATAKCSSLQHAIGFLPLGQSISPHASVDESIPRSRPFTNKTWVLKDGVSPLLDYPVTRPRASAQRSRHLPAIAKCGAEEGEEASPGSSGAVRRALLWACSSAAKISSALVLT